MPPPVLVSIPGPVMLVKVAELVVLSSPMMVFDASVTGPVQVRAEKLLPRRRAPVTSPNAPLPFSVNG